MGWFTPIVAKDDGAATHEARIFNSLYPCRGLRVIVCDDRVRDLDTLPSKSQDVAVHPRFTWSECSPRSILQLSSVDMR
jgi:hypothetical protein